MRDLQRTLAQPDTVLFVGAGLSIRSGLPTWASLLEELADFLDAAGLPADIVRMEARRGDLLQAASYGFHQLTKPQIGTFIRQACRLGIATPHEIHRALVSLGPSCYLTTNYDDLIEQSLRRWRPKGFFRPSVTNRHLTELAEIVHARATNFVFKPHGDAGDSESIILTREQYRQLLPGGERHSTLESVKMLLASRPMVYVGFGLRDPDFLYVRDLLANTYQGGSRDHYAIVADVSEHEINYWRTAYGIHLVGYATTARVDGSRDHARLLALLEELVPAAVPCVAPMLPTFSSHSAETVLMLARHAARLARASRCTPELPLRVQVSESKPARLHDELDPFNGVPVETLLDQCRPTRY